jgi:hypothetical protein
MTCVVPRVMVAQPVAANKMTTPSEMTPKRTLQTHKLAPECLNMSPTIYPCMLHDMVARLTFVLFLFSLYNL